MGIGRRKAGTVVRCPTCSSEVTVPDPNAKVSEKPRPGRQPDVFERSDFDEIFRALSGPQRSRAGAAAPSQAAPAAPRPDDLAKPAEGVPGTKPVQAGLEKPAYDLAKPTEAAPGAKPPEKPVTFQPTESEAGRRNGSQTPTRAGRRVAMVAVIALVLAFGAGLLAGIFVERGQRRADESPAQAPGPP
jgi:hypothetical protein